MPQPAHRLSPKASPSKLTLVLTIFSTQMSFHMVCFARTFILQSFLIEGLKICAQPSQASSSTTGCRKTSQCMALCTMVMTFLSASPTRTWQTPSAAMRIHSSSRRRVSQRERPSGVEAPNTLDDAEQEFASEAQIPCTEQGGGRKSKRLRLPATSLHFI